MNPGTHLTGHCWNVSTVSCTEWTREWIVPYPLWRNKILSAITTFLDRTMHFLWLSFVFCFVIMPGSHTFCHHGDRGQLTVGCHHSADLVTTPPSITHAHNHPSSNESWLKESHKWMCPCAQQLWFEPGSLPKNCQSVFAWWKIMYCVTVLVGRAACTVGMDVGR